MRFIHKNTGYLVVGSVAIILLIIFNNSVNNQVFFEKWPCYAIEDYSVNGSKHFPKEGLTEEQSNRFNVILKECQNEK